MLETANAIVGTKQVLKAMREGKLKFIYLAEDVDAHLGAKLRSAALENGIELKSVPTMKELGESCGIDVGAACAGITN